VTKECNITDKVEMLVKDGNIIIVPIENPRKEWNEKFQQMNAAGDDKLLINDTLSEDLEDWQW
jgi:antitoxin MazE